MKNIIISATKLKADVSEILNTVHFKGSTAIIKRHGKPIAKIVPVGNASEKTKTDDLAKLLNSYYGSMTDLPSAAKARKFRHRDLKL